MIFFYEFFIHWLSFIGVIGVYPIYHSVSLIILLTEWKYYLFRQRYDAYTNYILTLNLFINQEWKYYLYRHIGKARGYLFCP